MTTLGSTLHLFVCCPLVCVRESAFVHTQNFVRNVSLVFWLIWTLFLTDPSKPLPDRCAKCCAVPFQVGGDLCHHFGPFPMCISFFSYYRFVIAILALMLFGKVVHDL